MQLSGGVTSGSVTERRCPNGHEVTEVAAFCPECGERANQHCENGHVLDAGHVYCAECGAKADAGTTGTVRFSFPQRPPRFLSNRPTHPLWLVVAVVLCADLALHLTFQVFVPPMLIRVLATVVLYVQATRWLTPVTRTKAMMLLAVALGGNLINDYLIFPLHGLPYGWPWGSTPLRGRTLVSGVGIVGFALGLAAYFVPEQRAALRRWVVSGTKVVSPPGIGMALVLAVTGVFTAVTMFAGPYNFRVADWSHVTTTPDSTLVPYPYGVSVDEVRNDVRTVCSNRFKEQLAVFLAVRESPTLWYFTLFSGQVGAGTAVVDLDTGLITCTRV